MEVTGKLAGSFVSILGICQNIYLTDVSVNNRFGMDIITSSLPPFVSVRVWMVRKERWLKGYEDKRTYFERKL